MDKQRDRVLKRNGFVVTEVRDKRRHRLRRKSTHNWIITSMTTTQEIDNNVNEEVIEMKTETEEEDLNCNIIDNNCNQSEDKSKETNISINCIQYYNTN